MSFVIIIFENKNVTQFFIENIEIRVQTWNKNCGHWLENFYAHTAIFKNWWYSKDGKKYTTKRNTQGIEKRKCVRNKTSLKRLNKHMPKNNARSHKF